MNMSGENDGLGCFVSSAASMTCCVFFAVIYDAGDYSILSAYRACRDARRRVETGVSPTPEGGCGGHPPHIRAYTRKRFFAYQPQATRRREPPPMPSAHCRLPIRRHAVLRYGARSLTYRRRSRRLCPTPPDAYLSWIPASLNCSSIPAEGGNDEHERRE